MGKEQKMLRAVVVACLFVAVFSAQTEAVMDEDMVVPLPVHDEHYLNYITELIDEFAPAKELKDASDKAAAAAKKAKDDEKKAKDAKAAAEAAKAKAKEEETKADEKKDKADSKEAEAKKENTAAKKKAEAAKEGAKE